MTVNPSEAPLTFAKPPAYLTIDSIPADARLSRKQIAQALTDCGFPTSEKTLATKASRGGGPAYSLWGKVAVYAWGDAIDWVLAELGKSARNASEHKSHRAAQGGKASHEEALDPR
jgi:hypothetical protein